MFCKNGVGHEHLEALARPCILSPGHLFSPHCCQLCILVDLIPTLPCHLLDQAKLFDIIFEKQKQQLQPRWPWEAGCLWGASRAHRQPPSQCLPSQMHRPAACSAVAASAAGPKPFTIPCRVYYYTFAILCCTQRVQHWHWLATAPDRYNQKHWHWSGIYFGWQAKGSSHWAIFLLKLLFHLIYCFCEHKATFNFSPYWIT